MKVYIYTVKPELTTTSDYRPPVHNDHHIEVPIGILMTSMTFEQRPPVNNDHNFLVPKVIVVHRFDCMYVVFR